MWPHSFRNEAKSAETKNIRYDFVGKSCFEIHLKVDVFNSAQRRVTNELLVRFVNKIAQHRFQVDTTGQRIPLFKLNRVHVFQPNLLRRFRNNLTVRNFVGNRDGGFVVVERINVLQKLLAFREVDVVINSDTVPFVGGVCRFVDFSFAFSTTYSLNKNYLNDFKTDIRSKQKINAAWLPIGTNHPKVGLSNTRIGRI